MGKWHIYHLELRRKSCVGNIDLGILIVESWIELEEKRAKHGFRGKMGIKNEKHMKKNEK